MADAAPAVVGRPRNPDVEPRVRSATLALLAERGYAGLRIDDVAQRSGVAKTTIYRRWGSLAELVLDTVDAALGPRVVPTSGDIETDLEALVRSVHHSLVDNPLGWSLPAIGVDLSSHPELGRQYRERVIDPPRDQALALLRAGVEQGLVNPGVDLETLVDAVAGIWVYRRVAGMPPPSVESVLAVVRAALRP